MAKCTWRVRLTHATFRRMLVRPYALRKFAYRPDFTVPEPEWPHMTLGAFKAKLGQRWPIKAGGGQYMGAHGPKHFTDSDTIGSLPLEVREDTRVHQLVFVRASVNEVADAQPLTGHVRAPSRSTLPPQGWSAPVQLEPLEVTVRIFEDNGSWNLALQGKHVDRSRGVPVAKVHEAELSVPVAEYTNLTWGQLKARLHGWPPISDGGYHAEARATYTDTDTVEAAGLKGDPQHTKRCAGRRLLLF